MAELKLAVEDSSSLIHYDPAGAWTNPSDDPLSQSYSGQSFHSSSVQGATATIKFNGTGINIFAANRPNYGSFQLKVDGNVISQGQAASSQPEFNKLIASSTGLSNGPHEAILENTSQATIDLDMVEIVTQIGPPGYSDAPDAAATLSWEDGEAFAIWTTAAPDHRDFNLEVDGQPVASCPGGSDSTSALRQNHVQTGLGPGPHTLKIKGGDGGPFLDIDAIRVYSTTGGSTLAGTGAANSSSGLSTGAIAGIVAGAVLFMLIMLGAVIFVLRRRGILALGARRRSVSSDRAGLKSKPSSIRDIETGSAYNEKKKRESFGPVPLSTTSSFFALERASQFPPPRVQGYDGDYADSINSMVPPLPPMPGSQSRPQSLLPPPPTATTNHRPETATSDIIDAYLKSVSP
ncbi:hypothetical protein DL96DRAFT_1602491 [Flagelloscypha sp. PMI_526]|nr:hypothetical protein DL96DRAFT_1602491 [Flagelloscypha sp. PMI_526]